MEKLVWTDDLFSFLRTCSFHLCIPAGNRSKSILSLKHWFSLGRVKLLRQMNGSRLGASDEHGNPVILLHLKARSLDFSKHGKRLTGTVRDLTDQTWRCLNVRKSTDCNWAKHVKLLIKIITFKCWISNVEGNVSLVFKDKLQGNQEC